MSNYLFREGLKDINTTEGKDILERAHNQHERPRCVCTKPNPEMYVARAGKRLIVKRMPNTGALHHPDCASYEPPAELSGFGEVSGSAVQEDVEEGRTTLRLDFSLSKTGSRTPPAPGEGEGDTVRTDGKKLTLRAFLHYLWEQAGFHKWTPAMEGKRNWGVIRYHLMQALQSKSAKRTALSGLVYIPEPYYPDKKAEINNRRVAALEDLVPKNNQSTRKLKVIIGELKDLAAARYGHQMIVRHLPGFHLMLDDKLYTRLTKRFAREIAHWRLNPEGCKLIVVATFGLSAAGYATVEEASLMTVTSDWIPFESGEEYSLVSALIAKRRRFVKGLRYNLSEARPLAAAVLSDTQPRPVATYILPPESVKQAYYDALKELVAGSQVEAWYWNVAYGESMPALPAVEGYVSPALPNLLVQAESEPEGESDGAHA